MWKEKSNMDLVIKGDMQGFRKKVQYMIEKGLSLKEKVLRMAMDHGIQAAMEQRKENGHGSN